MGLIYILLVILLISPGAQGGQPIVQYTLAPGEIKKAEIPFQLWTSGESGWELSFFGPQVGIQAVFKGIGPFQGWQQLEVTLDAGSFGAGSWEAEVAIALEGAQGILGLPLASGCWLLPLNTENAWLERGVGAGFALENYQWVLLNACDQVYLGNQPLCNEDQGLEEQSVGKGNSLSWAPSWLKLQAGESAHVSLFLPGPAPAQELTLEKPQLLRLAPFWYLNGAGLELEYSSARDAFVLSVPALHKKQNLLQGWLQAGLSSHARQAEVTARFGKEKASLGVTLQRDWFDQPLLNRLQLTGGSGVAHFPFLFADGSKGYSDQKGEIFLESEALEPIFLGGDPGQIYWLGLGTGVIREVDATERETPRFLLPVLVWDSGLSWWLLARWETLSLAAQNKEVSLQAPWGLLRILQSQTVLELWPKPRSFGTAQWSWLENYGKRQFLWRQDAWSLRWDLPRKATDPLSLSVFYKRNGWQAALHPQDGYFSYGTTGWHVGYRFPKGVFWAEFLKSRLRLEVGDGEIRLDHRFLREGGWEVKSTAEQPVHLRIRNGVWDLYLAKEKKAGWRAGIRLNTIHAFNAWQIALQSAWQAGNGLLLGELGYTLGYKLSEYGAIYAQTTYRFTDTLQKNCELGVSLNPLPYWAAQIGWNKETGPVWKVGVALPFLEADF